MDGELLLTACEYRGDLASLVVLDGVRANELKPGRIQILHLIADQMAATAWRLQHQRLTDSALKRNNQLAFELEQTRLDLDEGQRLSRTGTWRWVLFTDELDWSQQTCRMYGSYPAEGPWTQERFLAHVHHEDRAAVERSSDEVLLGREIVEDEYRVVLDDGTI